MQALPPLRHVAFVADVRHQDADADAGPGCLAGEVPISASAAAAGPCRL